MTGSLMSISVLSGGLFCCDVVLEVCLWASHLLEVEACISCVTSSRELGYRLAQW